MLKEHIDSKERVILTSSGVAQNAGHSIHRGTPREIFVRDFLSDHLSERVAVGTGEIIDSSSLPGQQRNQIDIVIYKRDYPKLHLGGNIFAFLAESVVATIEIKSTLAKSDLEKAIVTAAKTKALKQSIHTSFTAGHQPPAILNYVVAYDGPATMNTVYEWIAPIHRSNGITVKPLPLKKRFYEPSPSLDGIFVLGKGFVQYDNIPLSFVSDEARRRNPEYSWFWANLHEGTLFYLFIQLTQAVSGVSGSWLDPHPYLMNFRSNPTFVP